MQCPKVIIYSRLATTEAERRIAKLFDNGKTVLLQGLTKEDRDASISMMFKGQKIMAIRRHWMLLDSHILPEREWRRRHKERIYDDFDTLVKMTNFDFDSYIAKMTEEWHS